MWKELAAGILAVSAIGCGAPKPTPTPTEAPINLGDCRQHLPSRAYHDTLKPGENTIYEATSSKGKKLNISVVNDFKNSQSLAINSSSFSMDPLLIDPHQLIVASDNDGVVFNLIAEDVEDNYITYSADITCV